MIDATMDFFGDTNPDERSRVKKIALWLMNRRKGNHLEIDDFGIVELIRNNLSDLEYCKSFEIVVSLAIVGVQDTK